MSFFADVAKCKSECKSPECASGEHVCELVKIAQGLSLSCLKIMFFVCVITCIISCDCFLVWSALNGVSASLYSRKNCEHIFLVWYTDRNVDVEENFHEAANVMNMNRALSTASVRPMHCFFLVLRQVFNLDLHFVSACSLCFCFVFPHRYLNVLEYIVNVDRIV